MSNPTAAPPATSERSPEERKPAVSFRYSVPGGSIFVSVWANPIEVSGRPVTAYAVSCQRSYHDGEEWKYTTSFRRGDLFTLVFALEKAIHWLMEERENDTPF